MLRKDNLLLIANNDTVNKWGSEGRIQGVIANKLAGNIFIANTPQNVNKKEIKITFFDRRTLNWFSFLLQFTILL